MPSTKQDCVSLLQQHEFYATALVFLHCALCSKSLKGMCVAVAASAMILMRELGPVLLQLI